MLPVPMASTPLQLPFNFAFDTPAAFGSFLCENRNAAVLHHLQVNAANSGQLTWLWGSPGSGRTHLLQAFCKLHPDAIYLPLQKLLDYEPASLASLQGSSLLVLDDFGLAAGKPEWEEQLFILCQQLLVSSGRLLCAAALPPAQLPLGLADLRSRLQLALVYEVHELSDEAKPQVLIERARQRGIELREEAANYILGRHPRNLHELMAVLDQLDRQALTEQRKLTIPFIKAAMHW